MAPAALWVALVFELQLWATGHTVPAQVVLTPYKPEPGYECQISQEYYDRKAQMCCAKCPPGQYVKHFCNKTSDTVCADCEASMYTQVWNQFRTCLSCSSSCTTDQVEIRACTKQQNRVCACEAGRYCALKTHSGSCRQCMRLSKCGPGFGVASSRRGLQSGLPCGPTVKRLPTWLHEVFILSTSSGFSLQGAPNGNVLCKACAPGTFSDTTSSTDVCRPHRICSILAIPGNASTDAVCAPESPTLSAIPRTLYVSQPEPTRSQPLDQEPGPSQTPSILTSLGSTPIIEQSTKGGISLPIGLIVGVTSLGLLMLGLVNCIILVQRKKKPSCLQRDAKVPHVPDEKSQDAVGLEQQHLLTTAPSSSSSSLESSASAGDRRAPPGGHPQARVMAEAQGFQEARASSRISDSSHGSHGTHVNVTCIVNVCSSSDHSSQCSSQASATVGDPDAKPSASPKDEQVPFSQEECPSQSPCETTETLQSHEKPLPLGVPDMGMKPSQAGWFDQIAVKVA